MGTFDLLCLLFMQPSRQVYFSMQVKAWSCSVTTRRTIGRSILPPQSYLTEVTAFATSESSAGLRAKHCNGLRRSPARMTANRITIGTTSKPIESDPIDSDPIDRLPERTVQTGVGDVAVQIPKVRGSSWRRGVRFHCALLPPCLMRAQYRVKRNAY